MGVPSDVDTFSVTDAAKILGVQRSALVKMVRQQRLVPMEQGRKTLLPRSIVEELAVRQSCGMSQQTANHYSVALRSFGTWLAGPERRLPRNPFADLALEPVTEKRHARRELTIDSCAISST